MGYLYFHRDGKPVEVSERNPLPVTGAGGGGGMGPEDISATAPATWDTETATVGVDVGTGAAQVAAGNHTHTAADVGAAPASHTHDAADIDSGTLAAARIPNLAASRISSGVFNSDRLPTAEAVPDATDDPVATVNALLASLRAAGYLATE